MIFGVLRACRKRVRSAASWITASLVAGPDNPPVITDARTVAKNLPLAVLSALAGRGQRRGQG